MGVGGARLGNVRAPGDDIAGVVPVGGLRHVGLLAPGHGRGGRQVAIPVIETQAGTAEQREIAGTGSVRDHRHRRNRRETGHAVRAIIFDGPDVGGGNQLVQLFPVRADKPAFTACLSVALRFLRIVLNGIPGEYRVAVLRQRLAPEFNQPAAHQRIFEAVGAVEVPGVACAAWATAWLMVRQVRASAGVIGLLGFPGHQSVFDINLPAAGAGTVHAVGRAHNLVELPALAVAVFPVPVGVIHLPVPIGETVAFCFEVTKAVQQFAHDISPASIAWPEGAASRSGEDVVIIFVRIYGRTPAR